MSRLTVKRVYDPPAPADGTRILVDRLWPRGIAREKIGLWLKEIAPSDALRHEFHGHPDRWRARWLNPDRVGAGDAFRLAQGEVGAVAVNVTAVGRRV